MDQRIIFFVVTSAVLYFLAFSLVAATASPEQQPVSSRTNQDIHQSTKILSIPLVPHHVVRQRRLAQGLPDVPTADRPGFSRHDGRALSQDYEARQVAGLFQGYGTHYADVWCGTPNAQRQTVIVDTGSGVTAFPCKGCDDCGVPKYHIDPLFDGDKSSTYRTLKCDECLKGTCDSASQCHMGMSYAEGSSWRAKEVVDSCYVGGLHTKQTQDDGNPDDLDPMHAPSFAFDLKFGCQSSVTGLFKTQLADGIMGMDLAPAAFWWQMWSANKIEKKAFSMCFSRSDEAARTGTVAGAMSLGGTDERLHGTPMVYSSSPERSSSGFYVVHLRAIYLREGGGGTSAVSNPRKASYKLDAAENILNSGRAIVDSGTTDTYFTRKIAHVFAAAYKELTGKDYTHDKQTFTPEELSQEPTILLQVAGDESLNTPGTPSLVGDLDTDHPHDILIAIPPEHYYEWDPDESAYVGRFYTDEGSGSVIGANAMMGHEVFFDVENHRIGWSESSCDYASLVKPFTTEDFVPAGDEEDTTASQTEGPDDSSGYDSEGTLEPPDEIPIAHEPAPIDEIPISQEPAPIDELPPDDSTEPNHEDPYDNQKGNEEPSGDYTIYDQQQSVCSSIKCQLSVLCFVLLITVYCACRFMRRQRYALTDSHELELHTAGEFINSKEGGYHQTPGEYAGEYT